jgi:hypothetical protein
MTATFPPIISTPDALSPRIFIPGASTPKSHVNWNTPTFATATIWFASANQSSGAVNDECSYEFYAQAGTYTLDTFWSTGANRGQVQLSIDGVTVGATVETYTPAAGNTRNVVPGMSGRGT